MMCDSSYDAVVIGGGFYGSVIAAYLARQRGLRKVLLVERESELLQRASYNNQARVHNGYHYPRSFTTAYRSRVNLPKFVSDWPGAVEQSFTKLYAIARRNSKVTSKQFERFCRNIGADIYPAESDLFKLFEPRLIESVFHVQEYAFDSTLLADWAVKTLKAAGVYILYRSRVSSISKTSDQNLPLRVRVESGRSDLIDISCRYVFNCTYSGLNQFGGDHSGVRTSLKQEITEMALMQMPAPLDKLGITVMDGPFFSMMPFPSRGLHTLSHVRYTPHLNWVDERGVDPYAKLDQYPKVSRFDRMVRDVARYVPSMMSARYIDSLFEVKTVLVKSEGDDGRPILFERSNQYPGFYSVLGGKIDNVYDVIEMLETEQFVSSPQ